MYNMLYVFCKSLFRSWKIIISQNKTCRWSVVWKKSYFFNKICASTSCSHTPSLKFRWRQISHATIYQKCFISFKTHLIYSPSIIRLILLRNILFRTCMDTNTYILFSLHQKCLFLKIHSFMNVYHQGKQYVQMPLKMFFLY